MLSQGTGIQRRWCHEPSHPEWQVPGKGLAPGPVPHLVVMGHPVQGFHKVRRPLQQHFLQEKQGGESAEEAASCTQTRTPPST